MIRRHPLFRPVIGALAVVMILSMVSPSSASALPSINPLDAIPSLNPAEWTVDGFKAILKFIFGDHLDQLGKGLINLLLAVPLLTSKQDFPKLNEYRSYITGGSWGLLGLSFLICSIRYMFSPGGSGAYEGLIGFIRTAGAICIILIFSPAFDMLSRIVNSFTVALIKTPIIGHAFEATLSVDPSVGGIGMILSIISVGFAIFLLLIKVIVTTLLAVLFLLSPLAIALWPIEELAWAMRSLLQAMGALMIFPIIWSVCFGAFAVLPADALFPGSQGDVINSILTPLITLAALVIMVRLPFAVLAKAGEVGIAPGVTRGMKHMSTAKSFLPGPSPTMPARAARSRVHPAQGRLWG